MPRPRRPADDPHFTWQEGDVTFILPEPIQTPLSEELHTILWSLENVKNKAGLDDVMLNVLSFLTDNPQDQAIVGEALTRAQNRVEHSS